MKTLSLNYITKLKKKYTINEKIIAYDIETKVHIIDGEIKILPQLACFYDGKKYNSFFIDYYKDHDEIIIASIKKMLIRKYNKFTIF